MNKVITSRMVISWSIVLFTATCSLAQKAVDRSFQFENFDGADINLNLSINQANIEYI